MTERRCENCECWKEEFDSDSASGVCKLLPRPEWTYRVHSCSFFRQRTVAESATVAAPATFDSRESIYSEGERETNRPEGSPPFKVGDKVEALDPVGEVLKVHCGSVTVDWEGGDIVTYMESELRHAEEES